MCDGTLFFTVLVHTTTNLNSPYMMYVWVDLKLNQWFSIQYAIDSWVGYRKSVLWCVLTDVIILVLENDTPTTIINSYKEIMMYFVPYKICIDGIIRKILAEKPIIKVYPK